MPIRTQEIQAYIDTLTLKAASLAALHNNLHMVSTWEQNHRRIKKVERLSDQAQHLRNTFPIAVGSVAMVPHACIAETRIS